MAKFAHIDSNNILQGWYDDEIHDSIPTPNVEVTDAQWQTSINNNHNKVNNDGTSETVDLRTAADKLSDLRSARNSLLQETDFYALSDVTMSTEMTTYRQALRDITDTYSSMDDEGFTWPTKPE